MADVYKKGMPLTQSRLKEVLDYNKNTGEFRWKVARGCKQKGSIAGHNEAGAYVVIRIDNIKYKGHRLAWLYMNGELPDCDIDHVNHNRYDNRIENLRTVTRALNNKNRPKSPDNKSGTTGVCFHKTIGKWQSFIRVNGVQKYLGVYITLLAAETARHVANIKYGFHKNHGK